MEEIPLAGGDMNLVVRVGDTVRRPPEPPGVRALLQWFERVGFDGAPRFLGDDDEGREILTFVEGDAAFAPIPARDELVVALGRLLRAAHDAQDEFVAPPDPGWRWGYPEDGDEVIGHGDLYWTNVILREGLPAALIDWELARPMTRVLEVALAATYWAPIRIDEQCDQWGLLLPFERRGERLRLLCDAYGLDGAQRASLVDELVTYRRLRIENGDFRGTAPPEVIRANLRWTETHAAELATFLA
jgi:hypothetical protein